MTEFADLGLPEQLVARIKEIGLETPTPIQTRAIPVAMEGRDVMGLAQTGTGKTAAFGLPLIAQISGLGRPDPKAVRALVLAPTRELANQIADTLRTYVTGTPLKVGLVVGGASINAQAQRLQRGTDILVATPGRLIDLLQRKAVSLAQAKFLVLDEADQMLDMGFIHALRQIVPHLPSPRQTMLFSATMPKLMSELASNFLTHPERIQVSPPGKAADKIDQSVHFIAKAEKPKLLIELLDAHRDELALVFARTKHGAERLMKSLANAGFAAGSIHGNKSQGQRDRALKAFRSGELRVLVATDVAARGLDIPEVRHVYNFDLPNVPDNYVHRIGRTARAGREGSAIAFCAPDEMKEYRAILKVMKIDIPVASGRPWEGAGTEGRKKSGRPQKSRGNAGPGGENAGGQRRRRRPANGSGGGRRKAAA